ncbi:CidA/LrgA family protein [Streptococcus gallinaceus]|uniref:Holin-like protein n=1 Tax=Streptococcus gallinaceus TaxID=165758 RepID=A0ABV2JK30_9STRE|nr:CidA/LrgA family protein [Streptococcus gallinaceus]MCP1640262.1 holin-like protein [Streptococcus gallinaceus]MCP1771045.1 holin-like protein [Streptococcus gallinaceus]
MKLYVQLMIILCFSFAGEAISTLFHLPVPGSIIGLLLLFIALEMKWIRLRHIDKVGSFLLANMTILFLPPTVGIMENFTAIKPYLLPISLIIGGALVLNMVVIAFVVGFIKNRYEGDFEEGK